MDGFAANMDEEALENTDFRRVFYTGEHMQLIVMSLAAGDEIGLETHPDNDQFFRFERGTGEVIVDDNVYPVTDGDVVIVPAGAQHNVINGSSAEPLKFYTIYAPPHHQDGTVHVTKADAETNNEAFDGTTTE